MLMILVRCDCVLRSQICRLWVLWDDSSRSITIGNELGGG